MSTWKSFLGNRNRELMESPAGSGGGAGRPSTAVVRTEGSSGVRHIQIRDFHLLSDIGPDNCGFDLGPTPFELQLGALGSCLTQTFLVQAVARGIHLEQVEVEVSGALGSPASGTGPERTPAEIFYTIHVHSSATQAELTRLLADVERESPICQLISTPRTLRGSVVVDRGPAVQTAPSLN
jgi:uncharacterized OsmC-like protein